MKLEDVTIRWGRNRLTGGEDDPHRGTEHEGEHAALAIKVKGHNPYGKEYVPFRCPDAFYGKDTPEALQEIVYMFRHWQMVQYRGAGYIECAKDMQGNCHICGRPMET